MVFGGSTFSAPAGAGSGVHPVGQTTVSSRPPTDVDEFLALLVASGLLDRAAIDDACSGFDTDSGLEELCSHLVGNNMLSKWQCDKLRDGKYKGFFLDNYRFVGHLNVGETTSTFLADDLATGKRVAIEITPPTVVPLRDGKPQYRVTEFFGD